MSIEIVQVDPRRSLRDFLGVVDYIYRDDPHYIKPLDFEVRSRLKSSSPFFEHGEAAFFTAYRNGWCVGRCSAQIDHHHLNRHKDSTGFFGFFDTIDDQDVAQELLSSARRWLADRGMKRMRGPFSLNINDESGCLVDGFDSPPMIMASHHRPYQGTLIEQFGLAKHKDLLGWRYTTGEVPPRVRRAHDALEAMPEVTARNVELKHMQRDTRIVMDIFNDAWSDTWGHIPYTENELSKLASDFRLLIDPAITYIAYINGEPAAVAVALPNLNEAIRDLGGKLLPVGALKLVYRLKARRLDTARLIILGITGKYRSQRKYAALSLYLYCKLNAAGKQRGYRWGELGWTAEDNGPVNAGIRTMGARVYKKYRIYEGSIEPAAFGPASGG